MVLNSDSNNTTPPNDPTTPTNPPPPLLLSRAMVTSAAPFYLNPQNSTFSPNLTTPNSFGWTGNNPSLFPNYVGMNPIQHVGSSSNQVENLTRPILQLGLGPYPSLLETHLKRNTFFRFGSETNQNENTINSLLQLSSNLNHDQTQNNSLLQLGSSSILRDKNKNVLDLGHSSSSNRDKNRDINSNSNWIGINPDLNQVEKKEIRGFEFHALGLDPVLPVNETENKEISLVLGLGSSPNIVENEGIINPDSNKVDNKNINQRLNRFKNETSGFNFLSLALDPAKPVSTSRKTETGHVLAQKSSSNPVEERGINPSLNWVENNSDFEFHTLALDPAKPVGEAKKHEINIALCQSSTPNRVENRGIKSDSIQVEKIFELCNLALDSVEPISEKEVVDNKQNQMDLIQKGKSKVSVGSSAKAKGSGENNNVGEGDRKEENEVGTECSDEESNTQLVKTWNLRPRKPRVNPEKQGNNGSGEGGMSRKSATPTRASTPRSAAKSRPQPKVQRPVMEKHELVISLTKEEIEHDFILLTGEKPPKKPNKRSKAVQKNHDVNFSFLNFYFD
ncbi:hypothetical protein L195_g017291 [Trifolium pratense]|uniref:Uncharacterized protein n=1 Tax=Trifolium pratense TaxID=57577 RepID=A0A2K3MTH6_TRIPR|nr:hypothetical protein L195_g017291 [Trifolium pratense]